MKTPLYVTALTPEQSAAHQRMISTLPLRVVGMPDDPEDWPEAERNLSDDELPYLLASGAEN